MTQIAIIDNYDSFTFNLVHLIDQMSDNWKCFRNDQIDWDYLHSSTHILLSPGPGIPAEAGQMNAIIERYLGERSIMGICLGFQALSMYFGGELYNLDRLYHGVETEIIHEPNSILFDDLPIAFNVGRYHSWAIRNAAENWKITARDKDGIVMAGECEDKFAFGVQFHPESIMTEYGFQILQNWLKSPSPRRR